MDLLGLGTGSVTVNYPVYVPAIIPPSLPKAPPASAATRTMVLPPATTSAPLIDLTTPAETTYVAAPEPPDVYVQMGAPAAGWQGGHADLPRPAEPPPAIPMETPMGFARFIEAHPLNALPPLSIYPYFEGGRRRAGMPSVYGLEWRQRMDTWTCIPFLASIPPRLPMPHTDEYAPGRIMMKPLLLPLRHAFRDLMPLYAVEHPQSLHRNVYDGLTYVLLNRCNAMQLHPAEAMAILYAVLNTEF